MFPNSAVNLRGLAKGALQISSFNRFASLVGDLTRHHITHIHPLGPRKLLPQLEDPTAPAAAITFNGLEAVAIVCRSLCTELLTHAEYTEAISRRQLFAFGAATPCLMRPKYARCAPELSLAQRPPHR